MSLRHCWRKYNETATETKISSNIYQVYPVSNKYYCFSYGGANPNGDHYDVINTGLTYTGQQIASAAPGPSGSSGVYYAYTEVNRYGVCYVGEIINGEVVYNERLVPTRNGSAGGNWMWMSYYTGSTSVLIHGDFYDVNNIISLPLDHFKISKSAGSFISNVISSNSGAYPSNGEHTDGYWYIYQGSDSIDPVAVNLSQSSGLYVGLPITISVDPSTSKVYGGTVSYQYQVQLNNDGQWITLGTTTETSYPYTIPTGATNLQFRVLASDDLGFTSTDYVNSASVSVVAFKPGTQQVLHRKNASGGYDVIWLETDSDVVIRPDGTKLSDVLANIESRLSGLGV